MGKNTFLCFRFIHEVPPLFSNIEREGAFLFPLSFLEKPDSRGFDFYPTEARDLKNRDVGDCNRLRLFKKAEVMARSFKGVFQKLILHVLLGR